MPDVSLAGCRPEPIAAYLTALGTLRIISEQADRGARGWWDGETFVLRTTLGADELVEFLTERYRPTPIITPWNGGGGFFYRMEKKTRRREKQTKATRALDAVERSTTDRLADVRAAIAVARAIIRERGLEEAPKGDEKAALLQLLRDRLPDRAVDWLDAAVLVGATGPAFPPLLGTGGTDGALDFAANFHQRVADVIDLGSGMPTLQSARWCRAALYGEPAPELQKAAIGQFHPPLAGGANQARGFEADSRVNPWTFLLMVEGCLLLAAAATRRLENAGGGTLSYPFSVRASGVGYASASLADESQARHELWLPLWPRPATLVELRALFGEGRAKIGRRTASSGVDFARAVATLGIDRGITGFTRYGFHVRNGLSYFAVPLGRWAVRDDPVVDLVARLDHWLSRLRRVARGAGPASVRRALRSIEEALLELCRHDGSTRAQDFLVALGETEAVIGRSPALRAALGPVPRLDRRWLTVIDDGTPELRLAANLAAAGIRERLVPLDARRPGRWLESPDGRTVWGPGDLVRNLIAVVTRAELERERARVPEGGGARLDGADAAARDEPPPLASEGDDAGVIHEAEGPPIASDATAEPKGEPRRRPRPSAALGDLAAFVEGRIDDGRLERLIRALSLLDWSGGLAPPPGPRAPRPPAGFALLALAHHRIDTGDGLVPRTPGLVARAAAGDGWTATLLAWRRLRGAGLPLACSPFPMPAHLARRAAAALAFPLAGGRLQTLAQALVAPAEDRQPEA